MKQEKNISLTWWQSYQQYVRKIVLSANENGLKNISSLRDEIFYNILVYFTPLSIIALVPGVYMSFLKGIPVLGFVDLLSFLLLIIILVNKKMPLYTRKFIFISILYFLSIVLIYYIGMAGPGLLFLLALTVLTSIIYSSSAGYYSAWANTSICIAFGVLNYVGAGKPAVLNYTLGTWIAVTANLVLLSFGCAKCLDLLLGGLINSLQDNNISEEKLKKANRLYQFISQINQSIVHIKDEGTLFRNSCKIAFEIGKFKVTWIGKFDDNYNKITLVHQNGLPEKDIQLFNTSFESNGLQSYVLRTGSYYVCNDIENDLKLKNWRSYAMLNKIRSCIILPIKKAEVIIGTFNLYAAEINFFDEEEIGLLEEATRDISFALDVFEKERKHKSAEELIVKNENRFQLLIEKSTDMKMLTNLAGEIIYGSPSVTKLFGYTPEEFFHQSAFTFFHPEDLTDLVKNRTIILEVPGKSFSFQYRLLHKNGNWIWCEGILTNMLHEPGINALVSNFRDISERKKMESQLLFDENNLNALINNTKDLMWSIDRDFKLITFNQPLKDIVKLATGKDLIKGGDILSAAFSNDQSDRFKAYYKRALEGEVFTETEYNENPVESWSEYSYYPIRKGDQVIGAACHSRDITQRKKTEENLKQSEASLKEAQAISHTGNWELDFAKNIHTWSDELYTIFGIKKEEVRPSTELFLSFIHPEDTGDIKTKVEETFKSLKATSYNFRFIRKDGAIRYGYSERKFEFDKVGKATRLLGVVQDITDRKLIEEEREKMISNIIQHSANLEQFASIVSHNLRAPVANIMGLSNVLKNDISEKDRARSQQYLFRATEQLDEIFNDLNKILQTRSEINEYKERVDLDELVNVIRSSIHNIIEKEMVQIITDFSAIDNITTIKSYIHSIFYNLISNSIKYRQPGEAPFIKIRSEVVKEKIKVSFKDNGVGIDLIKYGDKLFGLYKRFHLNIEGKGLGLFMVKTQIETLGGNIRIESKEGEGAEFIIELPL